MSLSFQLFNRSKTNHLIELLARRMLHKYEINIQIHIFDCEIKNIKMNGNTVGLEHYPKSFCICYMDYVFCLINDFSFSKLLTIKRNIQVIFKVFVLKYAIFIIGV